jgi:hypothetical protein
MIHFCLPALRHIPETCTLDIQHRGMLRHLICVSAKIYFAEGEVVSSPTLRSVLRSFQTYVCHKHPENLRHTSCFTGYFRRTDS